MPRRCTFKIELDFPQPLAGVDEAGCAPLAGPVVAAACILDRNKFPRGIDDSANLPLEKREALYARITKVAAFGVGMASVEEIDSINIYWARMLAMTRAVEALGDRARLGARRRQRLPEVAAAVQGDRRRRRQGRSIAPASIIAKVTRDRMMAEHARRPIRATAGSGTGAIRRPITAAPCGSLGRRRCTAEASAWCARSWRPPPSRSWPFLKSGPQVL